MFDSGKDAFQKLGNTVILLNETPIYITGCEDGPKDSVVLKYYKLPIEGAGTPELLSTTLDEKYVDFRSLGSRLGYINGVSPKGDKQAVFVSRMPKRLSVQGINSNNLMFQHFMDFTNNNKALSTDFKSLYKTQGFSDMLKGAYPGRKQAAEKLLHDKSFTSLAFARWFAFVRKQVGPFYLEYKGKEVGWSSDLKTVNLSKAYTHLQETLDYYDIPHELSAA